MIPLDLPITTITHRGTCLWQRPVRQSSGSSNPPMETQGQSPLKENLSSTLRDCGQVKAQVVFVHYTQLNGSSHCPVCPLYPGMGQRDSPKTLRISLPPSPTAPGLFWRWDDVYTDIFRSHGMETDSRKAGFPFGWLRKRHLTSQLDLDSSKCLSFLRRKVSVR